MSLEEVVEISDPCWDTIKSNLIEKRKNEAMGDLKGRKVGSRYLVVSAQPWATGQTAKTWTSYGNETARRRIIDMNKAEREHSVIEIIGNYHTHVYENTCGQKEKDERCYIGVGENEDTGLLRTVMNDYGLEESVQIVATVKIKEDSKRKPGERNSSYRKKWRITFGDGKTAYDVILAAYILTQKSWKEIKIKREGE
ncbi:hypothetical protein HYT23_01060 [Candidatus Pacearchaeota archaeon]|nr:hypothetical protein [Candidatus Pacearchaeota archaeon]